MYGNRKKLIGYTFGGSWKCYEYENFFTANIEVAAEYMTPKQKGNWIGSHLCH